jgi:hypothetical protein
MNKPVNLAKYKQQRNIEASSPRNIFGASVYRFKSAKPKRDVQPSRLYLISRHETEGSWPKYGIKSGDTILIRSGPGRVGGLISLSYEGGLFFNELVSRDSKGTIVVQGSNGRLARLERGEYEINGEAVKIVPLSRDIHSR